MAFLSTNLKIYFETSGHTLSNLALLPVNQELSMMADQKLPQNLAPKTLIKAKIVPNFKSNVVQLSNYTTNLRCLSCKTVFESRKDLKNHNCLSDRLKHSENPNKIVALNYQCHVCKKYFVNNLNKFRHLEQVHYMISKIMHKCDKCQKGFMTVQLLDEHKCPNNQDFIIYNYADDSKNVTEMTIDVTSVTQTQIKEAKSERIDFICGLCQKTFINLTELNTHDCNNQKFPGIMKRSQCGLCREVFPNVDTWKNHMKYVHNNKYKCEICQETFNIFRLLKLHTNKFHKKSQPKPDDVTCDLCGKIFLREEGLKIHILSAHNTAMKKFACEFCDNVFSEEVNLKNHISNCHDSSDFTCDLCGKVFLRKEGLKIHINSAHELKEFPCDFCDESFALKNELKNHILGCHDLNSNQQNFGYVVFKCNKCDKSFNSKTDLSEHICNQ